MAYRGGFPAEPFGIGVFDGSARFVREVGLGLLAGGHGADGFKDGIHWWAVGELPLEPSRSLRLASGSAFCSPSQIASLPPPKWGSDQSCLA